MIIVLGYSIMCYQNCDYCLPLGGALINWSCLMCTFHQIEYNQSGPFYHPCNNGLIYCAVLFNTRR